MTGNNSVYGFVLRGMLTEHALNSTEVIKKKMFSDDDYNDIVNKLGINDMDEEIVKQARKMAIIYASISAFENTVRKFVSDVLLDESGVNWWEEKISIPIKNRAKTRREEEKRFKWHEPRGTSPINYIDFSDIFLIMKNNWSAFEAYLITQEWTEIHLKTIERSRNIVMHSGTLSNHDIERLAQNIRDFLKQIAV